MIHRAAQYRKIDRTADLVWLSPAVNCLVIGLTNSLN